MIVRRLARPLLASVFIAGGIDALRNPAARTDRAANLLEKVPSDSVPNDPDLVVRVNGAALLGGGLLLATGRLPRLASTVLAAGAAGDEELLRALRQESLVFEGQGAQGGVAAGWIDRAVHVASRVTACSTDSRRAVSSRSAKGSEAR